MDIEIKRYWKKFTTYALLFVSVNILGAIFIVPLRWPVGLILWTFIVIGSSFLLIRWIAKNTAYVCPKCSHTFIISTATDFLSPHIFEKKLLSCPECGESSWWKAISAESFKGEKTRVELHKRTKAKSAKSYYLQVGIVIFLYLLLWANSLYLYPKLPETIPIHFNIRGKPDSWGNKPSIFILPSIATIFPLMHGIFSIYAAKKGYKSFLYPLLTVTFALILLVFIGIQYLSVLHSSLFL